MRHRKSWLLAAFALSACGIWSLTGSHADTFIRTSEAEAGIPQNVSIVDDEAASGGKSVLFGAALPPRNSFYIIGKDIVGPDGKLYFPVGANVGAAKAFDWRGTADGHSAEASAWGWNTVRLTLYCTDRNAWSTVASDGYPTLLTQINAIVTEYTAKKIVVIIECHDVTGDGDNTAFRPQLDKFWQDMADTYKTNPYVWFNPANEPYWAENDSWLPFNKHFYDLIRGTGAENIFVADALNAGNDSGWDGAKRLYDDAIGPAMAQGHCNVLFSLHAYGGMGGAQQHLDYFNAVQAKNLALIVGEYGYTIDSSSTSGSYEMNLNGATAVQDLAPQKGIGMLAWHGTHGDDYSLKNSGNAFFADGGAEANLSPMGRSLWDISHKPPTLGSFQGDYSASNCPSTRQ